MPNRPNTIDGTPLKLLVMMRITLTSQLSRAYSLTWMPDITPSGNATAMLPATRQSVPTIAGRMPPSVIPFSGIEVRNSQLTTPAPLTMMKPRIHTSIATTSRLVSRNSPKASRCERFLRFDIFEDVIMLSVRYCFFRFSRAPAGNLSPGVGAVSLFTSSWAVGPKSSRPRCSAAA